VDGCWEPAPGDASSRPRRQTSRSSCSRTVTRPPRWPFMEAPLDHNQAPLVSLTVPTQQDLILIEARHPSRASIRSPCPSRWRLRSNNTTTTAGLTHGEARRRLHPLRLSSLTPPALFTFATVEPAIRTPGNKAAVWCLRLAVDVHLLGTHPARRPRHARRHLVARAAWLDTRAAAPSSVVSSTSSPSTVAAKGRSWIGAKEHVEKQRLPSVGVPALL